MAVFSLSHFGPSVAKGAALRLALRKVMLLGAFELQSDEESRDGIILGSRRKALGFVLETSRENLEQIVAMARPLRTDLPIRATAGIGMGLQRLGLNLLRVELRPIPDQEEWPGQDGRFVQGYLVVREANRKLLRFPMTAAEAIQVAMANGLSIMAAEELLQVRVGRFLAEAEAAAAQHQGEAQAFSSFVKDVTPADFQRHYEALRPESPSDRPPSEEPEA